MNKDNRLSPLEAEMVAGLSAFCDALEAGEPIAKQFTVRTVSLDLESRPYAAADVKRVRAKLNASQALLAKFLGVSVNAVRAWEQGLRPVPAIACRFMDEILDNPELWDRRLRHSVGETARCETNDI